jgi:hypothetical protein
MTSLKASQLYSFPVISCFKDDRQNVLDGVDKNENDKPITLHDVTDGKAKTSKHSIRK